MQWRRCGGGIPLDAIPLGKECSKAMIVDIDSSMIPCSGDVAQRDTSGDVLAWDTSSPCCGVSLSWLHLNELRKKWQETFTFLFIKNIGYNGVICKGIRYLI